MRLARLLRSMNILNNPIAVSDQIYLTKDYTIELFDQDDWQYEITDVRMCKETKRAIFTIKFIGERDKNETNKT